ncbi:unnamed protein product [Meganyctiphanes norvegica]|uniref:Sphingomyelin synthase-like domain-containing protein n=1 Tax=Meganyctiphanes norvegica TaxID=48144 RepID=A0AAV2R9J3_MEGNR
MPGGGGTNGEKRPLLLDDGEEVVYDSHDGVYHTHHDAAYSSHLEPESDSGQPALLSLSNNNSGHSRTSSDTSILDDIALMAQNVYQRQMLGHGSITSKDNSYHTMSNGSVKIAMPQPLRDEPRFPKEEQKTIIAFLYLCANFFFTTAALSLTHERVPEQPPLPDVSLDSIKIQPWALDVSEIMIIVMVLFAFMIVVFHKHRWILFRRVCLILGLLYFYRSICMYVTVLPVANPSYYCSPKSNHTGTVLVLKRVVQLLSGFGLSINGKHTFCGDYIYSGHTMVLVLCFLIIQEYTPRRWWYVHWLSGASSVVGIIMVLLARGHYTIDCIIAYFITTRIFYIYHTMANHSTLKENNHNNYLERLWWYRFFQYFECNVQGNLPRQFEWPLPWPRRWSSKRAQRIS